MLTTGVSKIAASIAIVDATFTTTSLWRMRVGEMPLVLRRDVDGQPVAGPCTVARNGFSMITCGMPRNVARTRSSSSRGCSRTSICAVAGQAPRVIAPTSTRST